MTEPRPPGFAESTGSVPPDCSEPTRPAGPLIPLWLRLLLFAVAFVVLQLVTAGLAGAVLMTLVISGATQPPADPAAVEGWIMSLLPTLVALTALPLAGISLATVWVFRRFLDRRSMSDIGFRRPAGGWTLSLLAGTAIGTLIILLTAGLVIAADGFVLQPGRPNVITGLMVICLVFLAFQEELVFRGYVITNFVESGRPVLGVLLSSLIFWAMHILNPHALSSPWVAVNLFQAGVLLSLAFLASGNLWFPTALHWAWNAAQGPLLGIPVSGVKLTGIWKTQNLTGAPEWLTGGEFGLEASAVTTAVQFVAIGAFAWWLRRNGIPRTLNAEPESISPKSGTRGAPA